MALPICCSTAGLLGHPAFSRLPKLLLLCLLLQLLIIPSVADTTQNSAAQTARSSTGDKAASDKKAALLSQRPVDPEADNEDPYNYYRDSYYDQYSYYEPPSWANSNYEDSYESPSYKDPGYDSGADGDIPPYADDNDQYQYD